MTGRRTGRLPGLGTPVALTRTPGTARPAPLPAGADTRAVLADAGCEDGWIARALASGVLREALSGASVEDP